MAFRKRSFTVDAAATVTPFRFITICQLPPFAPNRAVERMPTSVHAGCLRTRRPAGSRRAPRQASLTLFSLGALSIPLNRSRASYEEDAAPVFCDLNDSSAPHLLPLFVILQVNPQFSGFVLRPSHDLAGAPQA